jgi:hypothetical protein
MFFLNLSNKTKKVPCGASHFQHIKHIVTQLLFLVCSLVQLCYNFLLLSYEAIRFLLPVSILC